MSFNHESKIVIQAFFYLFDISLFLFFLVVYCTDHPLKKKIGDQNNLRRRNMSHVYRNVYMQSLLLEETN